MGNFAENLNLGNRFRPPPGETHRLEARLLLRGYCTPNLKLVCFVWYLKIINTFLKNNACILKQIVQGTQKWHRNFSRLSGL